MTQPLSASQLAATGLKAQAERLRRISENIANVDTPGYRRKLVSFEAMTDFGRETGGVKASPSFLDQSKLPEIYDPDHPMADAKGFYLGSNVDLITEIADSKEASRSYEANLRVFEQSRQMSHDLLDILRR